MKAVSCPLVSSASPTLCHLHEDSRPCTTRTWPRIAVFLAPPPSYELTTHLSVMHIAEEEWRGGLEGGNMIYSSGEGWDLGF